MSTDPPRGGGIVVACLCADWCGTCRDWRDAFDAVARSFDAARAAFVWVDIEDDADVVGDFDVEDFPTLVVARGDDVLFAGAHTPHAPTLARLVRSALDDALVPVASGSTLGLPARLRAHRDARGA
jgi:thiol-disulfide isomerase/thioredoxin